MYHRYSKKNITPKNKDGHLYYVRLNTEVGLIYKLGFTTLGSIEERLSYDGSGDEKYIDKTLLFHYMKDGYSIEQRLHAHFSGKRAFSKYSKLDFMPLCNNGQTELYAHDILNMDQDYKENQAKQTMDLIKILKAKQKYTNPTLIYIDAFGIEKIARILGFLLFPIFAPLIYILTDKNEEKAWFSSYEKNRNEVTLLINSIKFSVDQKRKNDGE